MTTPAGRSETPEVRRLRHRRDGAQAEVKRITALIALQRDYLLDCEAALQQAELDLVAATANARSETPVDDDAMRQLGLI